MVVSFTSFLSFLLWTVFVNHVFALANLSVEYYLVRRATGV